MTAHPPAMDALEAGIAKVLRDELADGGKVVADTAFGIARTVTDYLTWPNVQPLLRRFVFELGDDDATYEAGFTAGANHALAQITNDVAEILDLDLPNTGGA